MYMLCTVCVDVRACVCVCVCSVCVCVCSVGGAEVRGRERIHTVRMRLRASFIISVESSRWSLSFVWSGVESVDVFVGVLCVCVLCACAVCE